MKRSTCISLGLCCWITACVADTGSGPDLDSESETEVGLLPEALTQQFVFRNEGSKRCLGVDRASTAPGARLKQFDCDCFANQQWHPDASYQVVPSHRAFVNFKSGLCIGAEGSSTSSNVALMQQSCNRTNVQQWRRIDFRDNALGEETFRFRNAEGLCMGVDGGSGANGAQIKQFACDQRINQRWVVHPPEFCGL
ncbi:MAG TPA: RICIN domain-containing protein [Polyangiales bacterium]|nr:RICIN domain-containing protein [Polyangiales bacterium]